MKNGILIICVFFMAQAYLQGQTKTAVSAKEAEMMLEIDLSEQDLELFREQTKQKVEELQQHITTIGDKAQPSEMRNLAEKEALKLFYSGAQNIVLTLVCFLDL